MWIQSNPESEPKGQERLLSPLWEVGSPLPRREEAYSVGPVLYPLLPWVILREEAARGTGSGSELEKGVRGWHDHTLWRSRKLT